MTRTVLYDVTLLLILFALGCVPQTPPNSSPNGPYGKPIPEDTHDEQLRKDIQENSNPTPGQSPHR
ncbi:MAG TPA: hypothetical protein VK841_16360 [Polyangiaceae bacterium]|nr:hypothetical protein [Polyangiaceae bacterium]